MVKERFTKLQDALKTQSSTNVEQAQMKIDKEATERMIRHALGSQIEQDRLNEERRAERKKQMDDLYKVKKTSTMISKPASKKEMHGATVVPEPAFLKHKKLLKK